MGDPTMNPYFTRNLLLRLLTPLLLLCLLFGMAAEARTALNVKPRHVHSQKQLLRILARHTTNRFHYSPRPIFMEGGITTNTVDMFADSGGGKTSVSHSDTNVQVEGVDEADIVKVGDDGYITRIRDAQVQIIQAHPLDQLGIAATLDYTGTSFYPTGLYRDGDWLVVLGSLWETMPTQETGIYKYAYWGGRNYTVARVYDLTDPASPVLKREVSIEGYALESRKIGHAVYLLARTYPRYYMMAPAATNKPGAAELLPIVHDSAATGATSIPLAVGEISYFPGFVEPDYVVIAGFRLDQPDQQADIQAYLGAGETVYASTTHLYLSAAQYHFVSLGRDLLDNPQPEDKDNRETTQIYRFGIGDGKTSFLAAGTVPGRVLNQFSMDQDGDYFRVATTQYDWESGLGKHTNGLYVLDANMKRVGSLEGLAPGEQIYATRFLGKRCYLVTFRLIDPLFAIDLSDPTQPTVLGELKIPGYSNYLHPYDETHLLGFGKDAREVPPEQGGDEAWPGGGAFYQGMKLSMFDVSDVSNPKELHSLVIGDRGTDSSLLYDHKGLFQNPARHLFGFPIQIARITNKTDATSPWEYGQVEFQGAHVYEVTPENGFVLKAAISHLPNGVPDGYWWNWNRQINRLVSVESSLFSLSPNIMQVLDLDTFSPLGELVLGQDSDVGPILYDDMVSVGGTISP